MKMHLLLIILVAINSCSKSLTTEEKLKDAALKHERMRIGKQSQIEELRIDSLRYGTTTLKQVYGYISLEQSAAWIDKLIEYKTRQSFLEQTGLVKNESGLESKEIVWLENLQKKLHNLDSLARASDSTTDIYMVKYLLTGKTNKSTIDIERTVYINQDFGGVFDTDSIEFDLKYYPKYP